MQGDTESDAAGTRPKPFLVGGSGWHRQVAALHSGGRYVPKGGFVVDFTSRGRYSNEINRKWSGKSDDDEQTSEVSASNGGSSVVGESESWADRIVLRHTQDELYELSPPLKGSGVSPVALPGRKLATIREDSSSPFFLAQKEETIAAETQRRSTIKTKPLEQLFKASEKQSWKPPGPCTPTRSSAGNAAAAAGLHRRSIPDYGKKKQNGKRNGVTKTAPPHDCTTCDCCAQIRQTLEETEAATRQDKAAAAHLRRRLEQEMAKLSKERRDFDSFKEEEMKKIRAAAEEVAHKQHRDRLAEGARQRAAAKSISLHDKAKADALRAELEAERREAGKEAGRHRMEVERLHRKISRMEVGIKTAESEKVYAWEEMQRYKELVQEREVAWQNNNQKESCTSRESSSSSVVAVIGGSPGADSSCCEDHNTPGIDQFDSPVCCSSAFSPSNSASEPAEDELENSPAAAKTKIENSPQPALPEIIRYPNGTIQSTWTDGHISTTFINGDIKQELPSGIIEYYFKEVSVWQVTHPTSKIETFYFPNGRVESHLSVGGGEKETLLPGGAGALRTYSGGDSSRQLPVSVSSLKKETLMPRPVPLMSTR